MDMDVRNESESGDVHVWSYAVREQSGRYIDEFIATVQKLARASQEEIEKAVIRAIRQLNDAYEEVANADNVADSFAAFKKLVGAIARTDAVFKIASVRGWL